MHAYETLVILVKTAGLQHMQHSVASLSTLGLHVRLIPRMYVVQTTRSTKHAAGKRCTQDSVAAYLAVTSTSSCP